MEKEATPRPEPLTKVCDWCKKRIKTARGIVLGSAGGTDKVWFCCHPCDFAHEIT